MYQSMVEGRYVPWDLLVKDVPREYHKDLDYLVNQLDWDANVNPNYKESHYLEPIVDKSVSVDGATDKWVVYGTVAGKQLFTAKELTLAPGAKATIKDGGAYGLITMQGLGRVGKVKVHSPSMIRYGELTEDEVFVTAAAASSGVTFQNDGLEPLVTLRYFGPDAQPKAPKVGDAKR